MLAGYGRIVPRLRLFALTSGAGLLVIPLDDDLHDALHRAYPAGEWGNPSVRLSSGDMAFAAGASKAGALAYLETNYFGGLGFQSCVLWRDGALEIAPRQLDIARDGSFPSAERPINRALAALGVERIDGKDEFDSFGLGFYRSNDAIWEMARPVCDLP